MTRSAQQAQNNAAAAAVHASIIFKEAESVHHETEYAVNHNYAHAHAEYKQSKPQVQLAEQPAPTSEQPNEEFDFAGY